MCIGNLGWLPFALLASVALAGCAESPDGSREQAGSSVDSILWHLDSLTEIGGHTVTVLGEPVVINTPAGRAIEFDGVDDGILIETHPLDGLASFTVEVVFMPYAGGATEQRFFHMQENNSESRVMFETRLVGDDRWFLDTFIKSGEQSAVLYAANHTHDTGRWYHAAIVVYGSTMRHYVDGQLELTETLDYQPQSSGRTSLGVRLNEVHWFKGAIQTTRFTPRALSADDFLSAKD